MFIKSTTVSTIKATAIPPRIAAFTLSISGAVISVTYALHTIVIRTYPGMAQAVCASCDALFGNKMLGSIAGDDTILIITQSEASAEEMCEELKKIFKN